MNSSINNQLIAQTNPYKTDKEPAPNQSPSQPQKQDAIVNPFGAPSVSPTPAAPLTTPGSIVNPFGSSPSASPSPGPSPSPSPSPAENSPEAVRPEVESPVEETDEGDQSSSVFDEQNPVDGLLVSGLNTTAKLGSSVVATSVGGIAGGILGSFIPIPVVGTALGVAAGSAIGAFAANIFGQKVIDKKEEINLIEASVDGVVSGATGGMGRYFTAATQLGKAVPGLVRTLAGQGSLVTRLQTNAVVSAGSGTVIRATDGKDETDALNPGSVLFDLTAGAVIGESAHFVGRRLNLRESAAGRQATLTPPPATQDNLTVVAPGDPVVSLGAEAPTALAPDLSSVAPAQPPTNPVPPSGTETSAVGPTVLADLELLPDPIPVPPPAVDASAGKPVPPPADNPWGAFERPAEGMPSLPTSTGAQKLQVLNLRDLLKNSDEVLNRTYGLNEKQIEKLKSLGAKGNYKITVAPNQTLVIANNGVRRLTETGALAKPLSTSSTPSVAIPKPAAPTQSLSSLPLKQLLQSTDEVLTQTYGLNAEQIKELKRLLGKGDYDVTFASNQILISNGREVARLDASGYTTFPISLSPAQAAQAPKGIVLSELLKLSDDAIAQQHGLSSAQIDSLRKVFDSLRTMSKDGGNHTIEFGAKQVEVSHADFSVPLFKDGKFGIFKNTDSFLGRANS